MTASKYCGNGLKIDFVVVVIVVVVIKLLSNSTAFVRFNVIKMFSHNVKIFSSLYKIIVLIRKYFIIL